MILIQLFALVTATLFTGAALYISLVEHPARLTLDDHALLAQWQPSYRKALPIQSGLVIVSGLAGALAWYATRDWLWLVGAAVILANCPFTVLAIFPINKPLMALPISNADRQTRTALARWGTLHAVRGALGIVAVLIFLAAMV